MGRIAIWLGATALALALGLGSASMMIIFGGGEGRITNGAWETGARTGAADTDPYSRARVAIFGLWALPPEEVVYYTAYSDDEGEPLRHQCSYEVIGGDMPARWFSVTLYRDFHLVPNPANRYAWSSTTISRTPGKDWIVRVNRNGVGQNALPMGDQDGRFLLSLRLYQPHKGVLENRASLSTPGIRRVDCEGGE